MRMFYRLYLLSAILSFVVNDFYFNKDNKNSNIRSLDVLTKTSEMKEDVRSKERKYKDYGVCSLNKTLSSYESGSIQWDYTSKQYDIMNTMSLNSEGHYIDEYGYYAVAMGSYYGEIGKRFLVVFDDGSSFPIIKADEKSDNHTVNGCYHKNDNSIIEWIIDIPTAEQYYGVSGSGYVYIYGRFAEKKIDRIYEVIL